LRLATPDAVWSSNSTRYEVPAKHLEDIAIAPVGFAEGNPLAAGLIGIGIGLLAATLMPTSREEQRFADGAQDTLQDIAGVVGRAGHETADAIRPAVEEATADVKSTARDAIDTVKDDAKGAADEVKTSAQENISDVRNEQ